MSSDPHGACDQISIEQNPAHGRWRVDTACIRLIYIMVVTELVFNPFRFSSSLISNHQRQYIIYSYYSRQHLYRYYYITARLLPVKPVYTISLGTKAVGSFIVRVSFLDLENSNSRIRTRKTRCHSGQSKTMTRERNATKPKISGCRVGNSVA